LSDEEKELQKELQNRLHQLLINAQKSKSNTDLLKSKLDDIVTTVTQEDISREEFEGILKLTKEYGLKFQDILADTFDKKIVRKINRAIQDINNLFSSYDNWQKNE